MKNNYAPVTIRAIVFVLAFLSVLPRAGGQSVKPAEGATETAAQQKFIREQFIKLINEMNNLAGMLEKTDPESAKALRQAVNQAQAAFIAQDMDKVAEYLNKGLLSVAANVETDVIKEMQKVLQTLRNASVDLDAKLERIRQWQELLTELNKLTREQEQQEQVTRGLSHADEASLAAQKLSEALKAITEDQQKLLTETQKLKPADKALLELIQLRDAIRQLHREQDSLTQATTRTPIDKLPLAGEAQTKTADKTAGVRQRLAKAAENPALTQLLEKHDVDKKMMAGAAAQVESAADEMKNAASNMQNLKPAAAAPRQKQASVDLKKAEEALSAAIAKAAAQTPAGQIAQKQKDLADRTKQLLAATKKVADSMAMVAKTDSLTRAAEHMDKATENLNVQDAESAAESQRKALKELKDDAYELGELTRKIAEKKEQPLTPEEQKRLAEQTSRLASKMQKAGTDEQSTPGQSNVKNASQSQNKAASQMKQGNAGNANDQQNDALDKMRKAAQELSDAIAREQEAAQEESLAKIDTMLAEILAKQKTISAETKAVYAKRGDDDIYARPEQLKLTSLSSGEGALAENIAKICKLLEKDATTAIFPEVMEEVHHDLATLQKQLAARQAGPLTQAIQEEVETTLQDLIDAVRKELADRRNKRAGGSSGAGGGCCGGKSPLVPPVAELRLLRTLQLQVNHRTDRLQKQVDAGKLNKEQTEELHKDLANRQARIRKMAEDIGKKLREAKPKGDPQ